MRTLAYLLLLSLAATCGCGKEYKPDLNAKGGGEHVPPEIITPAPAGVGNETSLQGKWRVVKIEYSPTDIDTPKPGDEDAFITISGNTILKGGDSGRGATFRLRPASREIDIIEPGREDRPSKGIYDLRGDTLKIAAQEAKDGPRPTEFRASGDTGKGGPNEERSRIIVIHLTRIGNAPSAAEVQANARKNQGKNNLKQIGLAMHGYHDANGKLPPQNGVMNPNGDPKAKPLLSWRVHILPWLEQEALYRQFKLDEPWDSPRNLALVSQMPKVYASPNAEAASGQTYYKVFAGRDTVFPPSGSIGFTHISDGTSNTFMVIEGGAPVTWTKPDDIPFDASKPLPDLKLGDNPRVHVAMCDGSVRTIDLTSMKPEVLKALITRAGGEVVGLDR